MNHSRIESRTLRAEIIFDPEDAYARSEGVLGAHPRPIGVVTYRIVARRVNGVREDLDEPLPLRVVRNPSGYDLYYGRPGPVLAAGVHVLRADSDYYHPTEQDLAIPAAGVVPVDLWPGVTYPFAGSMPGRRLALLRGIVRRDADGSPYPDVTVGVADWPRTCLTDTGGQWVIPGPPDQQTVTVTARYRDGAAQTHDDVPVQGDRDSTTVPDFRI